MKITLFLILGFLALVLLGLVALRFADQRAERAEWERLAALQPAKPARFGPERIADLPEPARRYFDHTIREGTPLLTVAEIEMTGRFSLGTKEKPAYQPMRARQILAAPEGFVWAMRTRGVMPVSGSDTASWTRFGIVGLIPVVRMGGDADHTRSAFGRYIAEAVFWTPAALLPGEAVAWVAVNENTARVVVRHGGLEQAVDVTVDAEGRPFKVAFQRWSDANPDHVHRLQPFGGYMSDFREVMGYRLPFRVEAGNMFGTDAYFPFFLAEVTAIRFGPRCLKRAGASRRSGSVPFENRRRSRQRPTSFRHGCSPKRRRSSSASARSRHLQEKAKMSARAADWFSPAGYNAPVECSI